MITIVLKLQSFLRYKFKQNEIQLSVPAGSTILDVVTAFADQHDDEVKRYLFDRKTHNCLTLFSVNKQKVTKDYLLQDNDELTILPPLAGG